MPRRLPQKPDGIQRPARAGDGDDQAFWSLSGQKSVFLIRSADRTNLSGLNRMAEKCR